MCEQFKRYPLHVTEAQVQKHNSLCARFNCNLKLGGEEGYLVVDKCDAQPIAGWYGSMYIVILPDGSSHS